MTLPVVGGNVALVTGTDYPPFADTEEAGGGVTVRIVKAAFERMGDTVTLTVMPWKRGYVSTLHGQFAGTFPYIRLPDRERDMLYSVPIVSGGSFLYSQQPIAFDPAHPQQLKIRSLCVPNGWRTPLEVSLAPAIERREIRLEQPHDLASCIRMVVAGRVEAFTGLAELVDHLQREVNLKVPLVRSALPVEAVELSLIAPRQSPGSAALIARFNEGLRLLRADASYKQILSGQDVAK